MHDLYHALLRDELMQAEHTAAREHSVERLHRHLLAPSTFALLVADDRIQRRQTYALIGQWHAVETLGGRQVDATIRDVLWGRLGATADDASGSARAATALQHAREIRALGRMLQRMDRFDAAAALHVAAREWVERAFEGAETEEAAARVTIRRELAVTLDDLSSLCLATNQLDEASEHASAALALYETMQSDGSHTGREVAWAQSHLGMVQLRRGDPAAAIASFRASTQRCRNPYLELRNRRTIGQALQAQHKWDEADVELRESLDGLVAISGDTSLDAALSHGVLGEMLYERALDEATHDGGTAQHAATAHDTTSAVHSTRHCCLEKARDELEEALHLKTAALGAGHSWVAHTLHMLGCVAEARGDFAAAKKRFEAAIGIWRDVYPPTHAEVVATQTRLDALQLRTGTPGTA